LEQRIEELASADRYQEKVKMLSCLLGVKTYTALSVIVETGDFKRFEKASKYAAYLGLVPGEHYRAKNEREYMIARISLDLLQIKE